MSKLKYIEFGNGEKTSLMEKNQKINNGFQLTTEKDIVKTCESQGIKDWKEILSMPGGAKTFREGAYKNSARLRESQAELAFGALLRAGVQNVFNDNYKEVDTTYEALVRMAASNKRQEFYAPQERAGFPKFTLPGGPAPETNFKGLDLEVVSKKFTVGMSFERELFEDDQTGQVAQKPADLGVNYKVYEEAYVYSRLFNVQGTLDGEALPTTVTYGALSPFAATGPFATGVAGVSGGIHGNGNGVNATASARISQTQIQNGMILAKKMFDQSGRPMLVMPDVLVLSPDDEFFGQALLNSVYNPSMSSTASSDKGSVGGIMSVNPIKGIVGVVVSRFVPQYGAMLVASGKGFVMQRRAPVELLQENPSSGSAFSQEVFRFRARARWEADFIDPKFMINLNSSFSAT